MNVLLDTHILLWAIAEDKKLPKQAYDLITNTENKIFYSIASIWETEIKHGLGKMPIDGEELSRYCKESGFELLSVKEEHVFNLKSLKRNEDSPKHNDPFDRIMISQAKTDSLKFITHDTMLPFYNEECIISV